MSDYLERLITSALDPVEDRAASTVVRPRRDALFERPTSGDRPTTTSPFAITRPLEEAVEQPDSLPAGLTDPHPSDDRAPHGPAWERGRPGRFIPSKAPSTPRDAPAPLTPPQPIAEAPTVPPRPAPAPGAPSASTRPPATTHETAPPATTHQTTSPGSTHTVPPDDTTAPSTPASVPAARHNSAPRARPSTPAAEQHAETMAPRHAARVPTPPPVAPPIPAQSADARPRPVSRTPPAPPAPATFDEPAPARPSPSGRQSQPAILARRSAAPSFRIEPSVEVEMRSRPEPATTIVVTIGRIEVRAPSSPPAAAPARPRQPAPRRAPTLSLDAYLDQRNGVRR